MNQRAPYEPGDRVVLLQRGGHDIATFSAAGVAVRQFNYMASGWAVLIEASCADCGAQRFWCCASAVAPVEN